MARRLGAWLVFLDETGLLMTPLVRATWAPRGCTPHLGQFMGEREKITVIGALCVHPTRRRVRLCLAFFPGDHVDGELTRLFLAALLGHLRGPVVLVWDRLGAHQSEEVQELVEERPRLQTHLLPPYCPELNPVEALWAWLKWDQLSNFAPQTLAALEEKAGTLCAQAAKDQELLRSFIAHGALPLDLVGGGGH